VWTSAGKRLGPSWVAAGLAALFASVLLVCIAWTRPEYLNDYRLQDNPDAQHYVQLGLNLVSMGEYSRQTAGPYHPDVLRTPVYPLLAGMAVRFGIGLWVLFALQILMNAATAFVVSRIAALSFGARVGFIAGVLYACDLTIATLTVEAMSEVVYLFLCTLALLCWITSLQRRGRGAPSLTYSVLAGLLLGAAILARPAGLYLPLAVFGFESILWLTKHRQRGLSQGFAVAFTAYLVLAPWVLRNRALYGVTKLTTADTINLVYFAAAGVYELKYHLDLPAAQARIAQDYSLTPINASNNFWLSKESVATMDARQRLAADAIIRSEPRLFALATIRGLVKSTFSHNVDELARITGREWRPGHGRELLSMSGSKDALEGALAIAFFFELAFALTVVVCCAAGIAFILVKSWRDVGAIALLLWLAYHVMVTSVVGMDAYARHRAPAMPAACIVSAAALAFVIGRGRSRGRLNATR